MKRFSAAIASATVFLVITASAFAQQGGTSPAPTPGPRMFYFHHPMFHGGAVIMPFVILFALIGFFTVLGFVVRIATRSRWHQGRRAWGDATRGSALNILEERFARGEIDKAEFEEKRKLLRQ